MPDTDVKLLARFALSGEAEGFRQLVKRHAAMVFGVARRVNGEHAVAEEVAHECFRELAAQGSAVGPAIAAWLHASATARAEHFNRSRGVRRPEDSGSPEATWDDISPHLDAAVAALPEDHREAFVLYLLEGRERADVAAEIGVDTTEMSSRVQAGVVAVQAWLKSAGVTGSTTTLPMMLSRHAAAAAPPALMASLNRLATAPRAAPQAAGGTAAGAPTAHTPHAHTMPPSTPTAAAHHPHPVAPHAPAPAAPHTHPGAVHGAGTVHSHAPVAPPHAPADDDIDIAADDDAANVTPIDFEEDETNEGAAKPGGTSPGAPGAPGDYIPAPPIDADATPPALKLYIAVGAAVLVVAVAAFFLMQHARSSGPPPEVVMSNPAYQGVIHINYWATGQPDGSSPATIDLDTVPGTSATRLPDGSLDFESVRQGTRWTYSPDKGQIILDSLPAESVAVAARLVDAVSPDTYVAARQKALSDHKAKVEIHQSKDGDLERYDLSLPPAPAFDNWQKASFWVDPADKKVKKIQATLDGGAIERLEFTYGGVAAHDIYDLGAPDSDHRLHDAKVIDTLAATAKPSPPQGAAMVVRPISRSGYGTWLLLGLGGGLALLVIALMLRYFRPYAPPDVPLGRHKATSEDKPTDQPTQEEAGN